MTTNQPLDQFLSLLPTFSALAEQVQAGKRTILTIVHMGICPD
jgi:hypothetical protein